MLAPSAYAGLFGKSRDQHTFAFFSDTHVAADAAAVSRNVNMADNLAACVRELSAWPVKPAALIINGDLALKDGQRGETERVAGFAHPVVDLVDAPHHLAVDREQQQVRVAKLSTLVVGALAVGFGLLAQGFNVGVLVILAIAVAASANFPAIVLSLFWRRFNTAGVIGGVAVGLVSSLVLAFIGPAFMKGDAIFPILNPTLLSMPLGFLGAVLGTLIGGRNAANEARFSEVFFQAQTGRGVGQ